MIRWSDQARTDLSDISDHYRDVAPDSVSAMMMLIDAATRPLIDHPRAGEPFRPGFRKWRVQRTPYLLLYRVLGADVEIVRVVHAATDWKPRR